VGAKLEAEHLTQGILGDRVKSAAKSKAGRSQPYAREQDAGQTQVRIRSCHMARAQQRSEQPKASPKGSHLQVQDTACRESHFSRQTDLVEGPDQRPKYYTVQTLIVFIVPLDMIFRSPRWHLLGDSRLFPDVLNHEIYLRSSKT